MLPLLRIENLSVIFQSAREKVQAVKNISLTVNQGEIVALVGESGSGKSVTALSILKLLSAPPAHYAGGRIFFSEGDSPVNLLQLSTTELQQIRGNRIAMIFQEPMTSLNPVMKCGRQVTEAVLQHKKVSAGAAKKAALEWFAKVKLPDPDAMFHRYPHQLSGGQKQRVMIAMAMCCNPSLLICDEPTTALDVTVQQTILQLIKELQQEQNMGVIFITHDLGVVAQIADKVAIMQQGEIVEQGSTKDVFQKPQNSYTKALIDCRPAQHPKGEKLPTVGHFLEGKEATYSEKTAPAKPGTSPTSDAALLVHIQNLTIQFPAKTALFGKTLSYTTAVDDISFSIYKGETLGLVGESGCGKTTLGRTLLRLIEPTSGKLMFNNTDITKLKANGLQRFRKEVQLVFQDPYSSLNPRLTIGAALEEPLYIFGIEKTKKDRQKRVAQLLEQVALPRYVAARYPHQFSGGQRQRIVIARALALNPHFLVCDESVSALDVSVQAQVLNLLNDLKKELALTLLFISHDLSVVRYMSDRIMVMNRGKLVESGTAGDVYNHPQSPYTKKLLAAIPKLDR